MGQLNLRLSNVHIITGTELIDTICSNIFEGLYMAAYRGLESKGSVRKKEGESMQFATFM